MRRTRILYLTLCLFVPHLSRLLSRPFLIDSLRLNGLLSMGKLALKSVRTPGKLQLLVEFLVQDAVDCKRDVHALWTLFLRVPFKSLTFFFPCRLSELTMFFCSVLCNFSHLHV
jgi:hypothetical protein